MLDGLFVLSDESRWMSQNMDEKSALGKKAAAHFEKGYNCAQSVLLTMYEHWDGKSDLIPKVATGFGGGIGRCSSLCGALTGGVMAIGVKYGTNEPSVEKRLKTYRIAREFYEWFEKKHGSVMCRELIGYDLSVPGEMEKARQAKVFDEKCAVFIRNVVENLFELGERSK